MTSCRTHFVNIQHPTRHKTSPGVRVDRDAKPQAPYSPTNPKAPATYSLKKANIIVIVKRKKISNDAQSRQRLINQSDNHPSSPRNSPSGTPTFPTKHPNPIRPIDPTDNRKLQGGKTPNLGTAKILPTMPLETRKKTKKKWANSILQHAGFGILAPVSILHSRNMPTSFSLSWTGLALSGSENMQRISPLGLFG